MKRFAFQIQNDYIGERRISLRHNILTHNILTDDILTYNIILGDILQEDRNKDIFLYKTFFRFYVLMIEKNGNIDEFITYIIPE